ncbi:glycerol-3-phosphate dehydrogenase [Rhodosalinus sp. K401]|uniref:glycerol-3-phosphate dehydrogenase n=1 Tax=Rhodosalinus sp. K401 TaxID=3239195 RepID=UPI0035258A38
MPPMTSDDHVLDLFVVGGGVNGCGIARDAAGRGLSVGLAEKGDIGGATSSASTKLFHGGLRYLEYFEFRLVREALAERETLLAAMPHIAWPMRFVLPVDPALRVGADTPAGRWLGRLMPWARGRRPAAMIRAGLLLYDAMGGRKVLPASRALDLARDPAGAALRPGLGRAFEYSDVWVEDSRLVALNSRDAVRLGARIWPRQEVVEARAVDGFWRVRLRCTRTGAAREVRARALVNAAGPWAAEVLSGAIGRNAAARVRLVRGSHIVTRRLFDHDRAYFLQGEDGRIVFALPYERDFTLIGTTDAPHPDADTAPVCTEAEADYLLAFVNRWFRAPVSRDDIVWRFAGVRPLYDDGAASDTAATRDYVLDLDTAVGAPLLSVFGGKITTYRRLAEAALARLAPDLPAMGRPWTAGAPLPGGDLPLDEVEARIAALRAAYPFLADDGARRLFRAYGTDAETILGTARCAEDLGRSFGATLTEAEVAWLMAREFAMTAEDVVWRRSKLGLRLSPDQIAALDDWMRAARGAAAAAE